MPNKQLTPTSKSSIISATVGAIQSFENIGGLEINRQGDQLMLSAQSVFSIINHSGVKFEKWFKKTIINNPLTIKTDDYIKNTAKKHDYLISMDLAKRVLMVSGQTDAYDIYRELSRIDFNYEAGQVFI